jgi:hypothetical protein
MQNALIHNIGDVETLRQHITSVYQDSKLLADLRAGALRTRADWTWDKAGQSLLAAYQAAVHGPVVGPLSMVREPVNSVGV